MGRAAILLLLVGCAACSQAAKNPGAIQCVGKATLAGNGAVAIYNGAGMLSFDCGAGAFIRQGSDVMEGTPVPTPDPPAPPIGSYFMGTDGRRYWSAGPPAQQPARPDPAPRPRPMQAPQGLRAKPLPLIIQPIEAPRPSSTNFKWGGDLVCTPLCH